MLLRRVLAVAGELVDRGVRPRPVGRVPARITVYAANGHESSADGAAREPAGPR